MNFISKVLKSNRGVGTIVGVTMGVAILAFLLGGTFLWQSQMQSHMNLLDKNRIDERLLVSASFHFDHDIEGYVVTLKVKNVGTIDVKLVRCWIIDEDHNDHQSIAISYGVAAGDKVTITELDALIAKLSTPFDVASTRYTFKVVTTRGNLFSSSMVPKAAETSNWPAIIIPDASWVKREGNDGHIHLEVFNRLDDELTVSMIVASRMEHGAEHSELLEITWILSPGAINVGDFFGHENQIYQPDEYVFIEMASEEGIVISSYYFVCG